MNEQSAVDRSGSKPPDIDYLAKDYASFRRMLLDRMATLVPDWQEHSGADLGVVLVELLAYVGDHLSYWQDAVATEAYLGTCRRRVSARRHARLVDYPMHDGCNARAWVQVILNKDKDDIVDKDGIVKAAASDPPALPHQTTVTTRISGQPDRLKPERLKSDLAILQQARAVFETMHPVDELFFAHNEIELLASSEAECCLPEGATSARLRDDETRRLQLAAGDVLIFKERVGPETGAESDADPSRRHAVRLTKVLPEAVIQVDAESGGTKRSPGPLIKDETTDDQPPYVEIEWEAADALPFPLCISAKAAEDQHVGVALGNIVLVDHGATVRGESLDGMPPSTWRDVPAADCGESPRRKRVDPRFRPRLERQPLTQAAPYDPARPAGAAMQWSIRDVRPVIELTTTEDGTSIGQPVREEETWKPMQDLLGSNPLDRHFVAETENDGTVFLRFGDSRQGLRPEPKTGLTAQYRIGNGRAGNVAAETIAHIVTDKEAIAGVNNPLPARGGVEPETIEEVRQRAPFALRVQQRAVTPEDYAMLTERLDEVQKAAAALRWTGSWHTLFVAVDRFGGREVDEAFKTRVRRHLERFRLAGHEVKVEGPRYVPLEIEMTVHVKSDCFQSEVRADLLEIFSNRDLPDGRRGVFHPDNLSFGQPVYLSPLYAAAQAVDGVASVDVTKFQDTTALDLGRLELGRLEIARLDNDLDFPEHGVFRLTMKGGKYATADLK